MERNIKVLVKNKFEKYIKIELRLISKRKEAAKESNFISTAAITKNNSKGNSPYKQHHEKQIDEKQRKQNKKPE